MGKLRHSGQLEQCVDLMKPALETAAQLEQRTDALPLEYIRLKRAAGHMMQCVTCTPGSADFNCDQARAELKAFRKQFDG